MVLGGTRDSLALNYIGTLLHWHYTAEQRMRQVFYLEV